MLWDKMLPVDQEAVAMEHNRVRAVVAQKKRPPVRKRADAAILIDLPLAGGWDFRARNESKRAQSR